MKKKKEKMETLQEIMQRAIEHWYQYGLISKKEYQVNKKIWR